MMNYLNFQVISILRGELLCTNTNKTCDPIFYLLHECLYDGSCPRESQNFFFEFNQTRFFLKTIK